VGGAVLLAPPSSLPLLAAASPSPHYGDAVRVTPLQLLPLEEEEERAPPVLIARLRPLLPPSPTTASSSVAPCACSAQAARGGAGLTVVLPRGVLVIGAAGVDKEGEAGPQLLSAPLPSVFHASIEPVALR
jgi:hypothetical protein